MQRKLTPAEADIMQVIWDLRECSVGMIRDELSRRHGKKPAHSTTSTLLRILGEKGFVQHREFGRVFIYSPAISREVYKRRSLRELLSDYFGGSPSQLVSFLVRKENLSLEELNDLILRLEEE